MSSEEARKKGFWKFPVLDGLAVFIITVTSLVVSFFDETAAFGIPALVGVWGIYSFYNGLKSGDATRFLYGARATNICALTGFVVLIVYGDYLTAFSLLLILAIVYIGTFIMLKILKKESVRA